MLRRTIFSFAGKSNPFAAFLSTLLTDHNKPAQYYRLQDIDKTKYDTLPFCIRPLAESAIRNCDGFSMTSNNVKVIYNWKENCLKDIEIAFIPGRVILQDFTGVPCVVDLAALRDDAKRLGADPRIINPGIPVDLVVDHSVQVDYFNSSHAAKLNAEMEMSRNKERFRFLKWGSQAFENLTIVPPGSGIVHQVNLEYLARVIFNEKGMLYPDTLVGTDSHTPMINGIGVLGWGVGGIEAEAAMLGQPLSMLLPKVVGVEFTGRMDPTCTATDLVLTVTNMLRKHKVVGKFVEFYGEGLNTLTVSDRATIANMSPECGSTVNFFPIDNETLRYLKLTGRTNEHVKRIKDYSETVGMFRTGGEQIEYTESIKMNLSTIQPCVAGPKRPQDRVALADLKNDFGKCLCEKQGFKGFGVKEEDRNKSVKYRTTDGKECTMKHGNVVIAAITSCTNTSNPYVLVGAGLMAKKALEKGLKVPPYVKTSLSPGSHVVTNYLEKAGLQKYLDELGFATTGYGCMTCIGNSGDLAPEINEVIQSNGMVAAAVLSGNRNFEARIHPNTAANYLASPPLVVAFALAGRVDINFDTEPIFNGVYLKDIWPGHEEILEIMNKNITSEQFVDVYNHIKESNPSWNALQAPKGHLYQWDANSTYIHKPPFCATVTMTPEPLQPIKNAAVFAYFGDSVTTDHISPAGNIANNSSAALFLQKKGVDRQDFNSYGARRGNDEVMIRGTFANTRLGNKLVGEGQTGPFTIHFPSGKKLTTFDAAMVYKAESIPLIILAGTEYGSGSSRDWAAKGSYLLGIKAVIAQSYERIHRGNLVGMGVLPFQFLEGESAASLHLTGKERYTFDIPEALMPGMKVTVHTDDGRQFEVILRIDTDAEIQVFKQGGILPNVLRQKIAEAKRS